MSVYREGRADGAPATVDMPEGMSIRYEMPDARLADLITGYNAYGSDSSEPRDDWFLPAPVMICIAVNAGPIEARIGNRRFSPMPQASLIGPSSRPLNVTTHGGTMVGIGVSPAGWAALTERSAVEFHNLIVPAETVLGQQPVDQLIAALTAAPDRSELAPLLDEFCLRLFTRRDPRETDIRALSGLIVRPDISEVRELSAELGITDQALLRLSRRYFGMPAKLLLRRARFLRSFITLFVSGTPTDASAIDSSYHDMSHFHRDANAFLGMTPRRFMKLANTFLEASVRARAKALGAPTQALHVAPPMGDERSVR